MAGMLARCCNSYGLLGWLSVLPAVPDDASFCIDRVDELVFYKNGQKKNNYLHIVLHKKTLLSIKYIKIGW